MTKKENPDLDPSSIQTSEYEVVVDHTGQPKAIGPYKVQRLLGEGGFGKVYEAVQNTPIRRTVAVKVLQPRFHEKSSLARFESEWQALARINHPNVAKVFDAGVTEDGQPYFAMELVNGIHFDTYCNQNKLSAEDRLKLFIPLCEAIHQAHISGVIHRDLKPSNVLVVDDNSRPMPKVIDFGLAKALNPLDRLTDKTHRTVVGQVVGSYRYMSPEQAWLDARDVDARTDIYSLGIMLYELLTGTTPIDSESLATMSHVDVLQLIRDKDPVRPSKQLRESVSNNPGSNVAIQSNDQRHLEQVLRGDLDWVVMRAVEKDRNRRYKTVSHLCEDVQRFLRHETVHARPPSLRYRLRKSLRRHPVGWLLLVFVLILAGVGVTMFWLGQGAALAREREFQRWIDLVVVGRPDRIPQIVDSINDTPYRQRVIDNLELLLEDDQQAPSERMNAAAALTLLGQSRLDALISESEDDDIAYNYALASASLGDWGVFAAFLRLDSDPARRTLAISRFRTNVELINESSFQRLGTFMLASQDKAVVSGLCQMIGLASPHDISASSREGMTSVLNELVLGTEHGCVLTSARWALTEWGKTPPSTPPGTKSVDWFVNEAGMTMLRIEPDRFRMGFAERPAFKEQVGVRVGQKDVAIAEPFCISAYEVTEGQFQEFRQSDEYPPEPPVDPKQRKFVSPTANHPAIAISWFDAILFCNWLSVREGRTPCYERTGEFTPVVSPPETQERIEWNREADGYRLPTEAEWEFVCRAGTTTAFYFGDDHRKLPDYAILNRAMTAPVGTAMPNQWGICNMLGNVTEWCWDVFEPVERIFPQEYRSIRGGNFGSRHVLMCMSGFSGGSHHQKYRDGVFGMRLVCPASRAPQ